VLDERRREFAAEGHRWFDLRRTKHLLTHAANADYRIAFSGYPIYAFAFPIPESETNTGPWHDGMLGQGKRGQNEFWKKNGDSWSPVYILPTDEGSDYSFEQ
ncbi:MAG: RagB/SusD family nutrient uptake outer membrane protein, partial [Bacteroidales bacterium]|nr:RagB/SusD family nutrient uptake outer membrane protein [Bacteroidales bacterium]